MSRSDPQSLKFEAARRALDYVHTGMTLGLGTGSTAEAFLEQLGARVQGGLDVVGVPTSERTARKARELGIPLLDLDSAAPLELVVDGTDEADSDLNLIKGGGGALLREKIVASSSKRMVVIADASKLVDRLGAFALPVEIVSFGMKTTMNRIEEAIAALGYKDVPLVPRAEGGELFRTDGGNFIVDCEFGAISDAPALARGLSGITGVVDHGLFIGIASTLIVARPDGVDVIEKKA